MRWLARSFLRGDPMKRLLIGRIVILAAAVCLAPFAATAQPALVIKPLAEKKVQALPAGTLLWQAPIVFALAIARLVTTEEARP